MIRNHYIFFMGLALLLAGCRKQDEPQNTGGQPFFAMAGSIDNRPVKLVAGEGSFMQTGYTIDNNGILVFEGNLKEDCPGCKQSLKIMIRNIRTDSINVVIGQSFPLMNYPYVGSNFPKQCLATFRATSTGSGSAIHTWVFADGTFLSGDSVSKTFTIPVNTLVRCSSQYASCASIIEAPVSLKDPATPATMGFNITALDTNNRLFDFTATGIDSTIGTYQWDFGDGQSGFGTSVQHNYSDSSFVRRVILSRIINATNDTTSVARNIAIKDYTGCVANFEVSRQYMDDANMFSGVTVEWTDAGGITYSSKNTPQDASARFTITAISEYLANNKGQKTIAIDLLINCNVSDGSKVIPLRNLTGRMAVAYP